MNAATQHLASEYASIGARHAQTIAAVKSGLRRKPDIRRMTWCEDQGFRSHVFNRAFDPGPSRQFYRALHSYLTARALVRFWRECQSQPALRSDVRLGAKRVYERHLRDCAKAKRWLKREADKLRAEICR